MAIKSVYPDITNRGFRLDVLDVYPSSCMNNLLSALQVTSLPAIWHEGTIRCGAEAVLWFTKEYQLDVPSELASGTTLREISMLRLATQTSDKKCNISYNLVGLLRHLRKPSPTFSPSRQMCGGGVESDEGGPQGPTSSGRHGTPGTSVVTAKA
jgi:hypothetical protein